MERKILIATRNRGKFKELIEILDDLPFEFVSLNDLGIHDDAHESGATYRKNAVLKAVYFGKKVNMPAIADDSGIIVEALKGELGPFTRRWGAGEKATDAEWLDYFLKRMSREKNKKAEFASVIALYWPGKPVKTFRGECKGIILNKPQVDSEPGIPLSSVFLANGQIKVFSALSKNEKNAISHRGKAIKKCADFLSRVQ